jgi:hypothetical protein
MKYNVVDTETINGQAFLICAYPDKICKIKKFQDIIDFLFSLNVNNLFCWNVDYDFSAIIKWIPQEYLQKLYFNKTITYKGIVFKYYKNKYAYIKYNNKVINFWDLYQFYKLPLDEAGRKYIGMRKRKIDSWLFDKHTIHSKRVVMYCLRDCELTFKLLEMFLKITNTFGLKKFYSYGYIARLLLPHKCIYNLDENVHDVIYSNYKGGWIEPIKRGYFKYLCYYDLKQAYGSVIKNLPCICDIIVKSQEKINSKYYYLYCELTLKKFPFYPIPIKYQNMNINPMLYKYKLVINNFEYDLLKKYKLIKDIKILKVYNVYAVRKYKPYSDHIDKLFANRQNARSDFENLFWKVVVNSSYGNFKQEIRDYKKVKNYGLIKNYDSKKILNEFKTDFKPKHWNYFECNCAKCKQYRKKIRFIKKKFKMFPYKRKMIETIDGLMTTGFHTKGSFYNIVYASWITSIIRCKIFEFCYKYKDDIVLIMTDGVLMSKKIKAEKGLGKMEFKGEYSNNIIIGTGIYQLGEKSKVRGYKKFNLLTQLKKNKSKRVIKITVKENISLGKIMFQNKKLGKADFNEITDIIKELNINFDKKRKWDRDFKNCGDLIKNSIGSTPLKLGVDK